MTSPLADPSLADLLPPAALNAVRENEPMSRHTTLRVGGPARYFWAVNDVEQLADALPKISAAGVPYLLVGHGSNLLFSDHGFSGIVIQNRCKQTRIDPVSGAVVSECGVSLGSLFAQTQRVGLSGLEWAIGIPGTVGGALVSNAGAYRGNIGPLVRSVRAFHAGQVADYPPEWLGFAYRDSRLRAENPPRTVILSATLALTPGADADAVLASAKRYQAERRQKQPLEPSAGSFFKNVNDAALAARFDDLAPALRAAGVVPTGFLSMRAGCLGWREGGAMVSEKHGNFLVNAGGATAADFRRLADRVKARVFEFCGARLDEEVLSVGEWGVEAGELTREEENRTRRLEILDELQAQAQELNMGY